MRALPIPFLIAGLSFSLATAAGCGSGGPYGFSRTYEPLDAERPLFDSAVESSYEEVRRTRPEDAPLISWFGLVTALDVDAATGAVRATMSLRVHQDRHLCSDGTSGSCRVTISDREIGTFTGRFTIHDEDREGARRLWPGSLVRIYGRASGESDESGGPVIDAEYYRHWPIHTFVTTSASSSMRR